MVKSFHLSDNTVVTSKISTKNNAFKLNIFSKSCLKYKMLRTVVRSYLVSIYRTNKLHQLFEVKCFNLIMFTGCINIQKSTFERTGRKKECTSSSYFITLSSIVQDIETNLQ